MPIQHLEKLGTAALLQTEMRSSGGRSRWGQLRSALKRSRGRILRSSTPRAQVQTAKVDHFFGAKAKDTWLGQ